MVMRGRERERDKAGEEREREREASSMRAILNKCAYQQEKQERFVFVVVEHQSRIPAASLSENIIEK